MANLDVVLDPSLKPAEPKKISVADFAKNSTGREQKTLKFVESSLDGDIFHTNYLEYLEIAWANHLGVTITPDTFWFTLLCEATSIIGDDVEKYRKFFTKSSGKTEIVVNTNSATVLPLDQIMGQLRVLVPDGLATHFLPDFSTTDARAREARYAAFADAVSPYYNYSMLMCGIPAVRLEGGYDDWQLLKKSWMALADVFSGTAAKYCKRVSEIIQSILGQFAVPDPEFLKKIFYLKRCGSGHQTEAFGWYTELFRKAPKSTRYVENFSSHVAKVAYKNLTTGQEFEMRQGLFTSKIENGFLKPTFGRLIFQKGPGSV